jgi:hypothetical protein
MCGAAAESILLSVAIAKTKDEDAVLKEYRSASGRRRIIDRIVTPTPRGGLRVHLEAFVGLLGYWRDDAGHGGASNTSEPEANMALLQLLRFAQFADGEWDALTSEPSHSS